MITSILGKVVDENGVGLPSITIEVYDVNGLHGDRLLGVGHTDASTSGHPAGSFTFNLIPHFIPSGVRARFYNSNHRLLKEVDVLENNPSDAKIVLNPVIPSSIVNDLFATNDQGDVLYLTSGNSIEFLIDDESAWARLTDEVRSARHSIHVQPFLFNISEYQHDKTKVKPTLISKFESVPREHVPTLRVQLESELADASARNVQVCILMHKTALWSRPFDLPRFLWDLLTLIALKDNSKDVENYFSASAADPPPRKAVNVRAFPFDRPTHAKLAIIDDKAFILGSPLAQEYFDKTRFLSDASGNPLPPQDTHKITELARGKEGSCRRPIHDVSIFIQGPAVADIDRAFLLHWNEVRPDKTKPGDVPAAAPPPVTGGVKVQIARTLCKGRFSDPSNVDQTNPELILGEIGVYNAYIKAIEKAKQFIYIENQYFVNKDINKALIRQMKKEPNLKLIFLINCWADVPGYSTTSLELPLGLGVPVIPTIIDFIFEGRQAHRIEDLLEALTPPVFNERVGIYTLWTHEDPPDPKHRPQIINNYIHSKVAIIDDEWATVGSANLDVYSLSREDNSEVNAVLFEDATVHIAAFRRRLWAEHLGLDPNSVDNSGDFFALWEQKATEKLAGLKKDVPQRTDARILPFPPFKHKDTNIAFDIYKPHKFLDGLDIDTRKFKILRHEPAFDFATGELK